MLGSELLMSVKSQVMVTVFIPAPQTPAESIRKLPRKNETWQLGNTIDTLSHQI
jgi:hypothetical protein